MTKVHVGVVDVGVLRVVRRGWSVLTLRRAQNTRSPGSWELVHGHIGRDEKPAAAARRELLEESGLTAAKLYSVTVNPFYLNANDTVQLAVVFAAVVDSETVTLGPEHDRCEWLSVGAACTRLTWPRDAESVRYAVHLLSAKVLPTVEDVLESLGK